MTRRTSKKTAKKTAKKVTPEPQPARVKIRGPGDLVAIAPYLLGFHPRDSLVALFFDRGRVALTARFDLPGSAAGPPSMEFLGDRVAALATRTGARSVVLLCYTDSVEAWPALEALVRDGPVAWSEAIQVSPRRWRSLLCENPDCCPAEGTAYDLSGHPLAAEAVYAGLSAVADRAELEVRVAGPPTPEVARLQELAADELLALAALTLATRERLMRHRVEQSLAQPDQLSDTECAELAALCANLRVRDVAWALMTRSDSEAHLALWQRVVSRTADPFAAGPLGLMAIAAWLSGNGALLNCGIERLAAVRPDYGLLEILAGVSNHAVPPSAWESIATDLRRELDLAT